jgi:hypothetical protein
MKIFAISYEKVGGHIATHYRLALHFQKRNGHKKAIEEKRIGSRLPLDSLSLKTTVQGSSRTIQARKRQVRNSEAFLDQKLLKWANEGRKTLTY